MSETSLGVLYVVICAFIEALAQIAWKRSADDRRRKNIWIAAGASAYCVEIPLYTIALTMVDVTVAFAVSSISFVFVALLSRFLLGERISAIRALGLVFILGGVILSGDHA